MGGKALMTKVKEVKAEMLMEVENSGRTTDTKTESIFKVEASREEMAIEVEEFEMESLYEEDELIGEWEIEVEELESERVHKVAEAEAKGPEEVKQSMVELRAIVEEL